VRGGVAEFFEGSHRHGVYGLCGPAYDCRAERDEKWVIS
jgi:hypothetical protein